MPQLEDSPFDKYWSELITSGRHHMIIIDPTKSTPMGYEANAPVGYANLMTILGHKTIIRMPLRELYGKPAHIYTRGFYPDDEETRRDYFNLPDNHTASDIMASNNLNAGVKGIAVIVTEEAIDPRDLQAEMIACNADTMPEVERDHLCKIGPEADKEWARLSEALNGKMIPSVLQTAPTMDRVAWLLRTVMAGLDMDIISHAAIQELVAKQPMFRDAMTALNYIQESYFIGRFSETSPPDPDTSMFRPLLVDKPVGFSDRYQTTVH